MDAVGVAGCGPSVHKIAAGMLAYVQMGREGILDTPTLCEIATGRIPWLPRRLNSSQDQTRQQRLWALQLGPHGRELDLQIDACSL